MRKIIASTFVTLDGVMEAPGSGDTTLPEHRGWTERFMTAEVGQVIMGQMGQSDAMLLGRKTYEGFAAFWPSAPADDPFTQRMNGITKYVVSNTLAAATWNNSTLIQGDVVQQLHAIKQQDGLNISIVGSGELIQSLLPFDVIDEYQLLVFPLVLGVGKHLFASGTAPRTLNLVETQSFSSGVVYLVYRP